MTMTTEVQNRKQTEGPHRPTAQDLALRLLRQLPSHLEVRAISICGQTGEIIVETYHEGLETELTLKP